MSGLKPFASLSSGLLARKGSARPAMRPQLQPRNPHPVPQFQPAALPLEGPDRNDVSRNDMGQAEAALIPAAARQEGYAQPISSIVGRGSEPLRRLAGPSPQRRSAFAQGRRAAFTLRMDKDRHRKLRLACTVHGRSAQRLVTEALDRLLNDMALPDGPAEGLRGADGRKTNP